MSSAPGDAISTELQAIRGEHQVRLLKPEEEGFAICNLPAGVFGFAYAPGQDEVPVFGKQDYHSFEIHKAADGGEYVIGFVTDMEATKLGALEEGAAVTLFPDPHDESQALVSVPAKHILAPKKLLVREDGNPFHFKIA